MSFVFAVIAGVTLTPIPPPVASTPIAPALELPRGVYTGEPGNTHTTFQWTHGGLIFGAAPTNHFIICLSLPPNTTPCTYANSAYRGTVAAFPRTQMRNPATNQPTHMYRYTFTPTTPLADSYLNRRLGVTVGACERSTAPTNCSFDAPEILYFTTIDLAAVTITRNALRNGNGYDLSATMTFINNGQSIAWGITTTIDALEALTVGGTCTRDTALANASFASVVLTDGRRVLPNAIPAGTVVKAILKPSGQSMQWQDGTFGVGPGLEATTAGTPSGIDPPSFTFGTNETEKSFVFIGEVDSPETIVEYDETNNGRAECRTYFR